MPAYTSTAARLTCLPRRALTLPCPALQTPPREGNIEVKMGHVCMIPDTKDFFIAYGDHPEWGTAHTVGAAQPNPAVASTAAQAQRIPACCEQRSSIQQRGECALPVCYGKASPLSTR